MMEGGAIDWAGHANNQEQVLAEALEFDLAIRAIIERLQAAGELEHTLIVVTADHEWRNGHKRPRRHPRTGKPTEKRLDCQRAYRTSSDGMGCRPCRRTLCRQTG